ncbi:MAG TPA: DNA polymerase III subunit gamma/tau [Candidatus Paceibacterota bacterium]|nr:DNA polymerase III subunit gamma/tau [Candidatus Paceibacterota bacterium]
MKFAEKYRPKTFDEVIGQEIAARILKSAVSKDAVESTYMFSGPSGVGKTTLGRVLSKAVLCENPSEGNPCCSCESCLLFDKEQHFGYKEMDAASVGTKEDMIKLRDEASFNSIGKKKIILLDECHDISPSGQDSLLKQTEHPPPHLVYIFCTTNPEKVKNTLRERCTQFQVSKVSSDIIFNRIKDICDKEELNYDDDALRLVAEQSEGHVRNALNILQGVSYLGDITVDNVKSVSKVYDDDIYAILYNIGDNLKDTLIACNRVSSFISVQELYSSITSMLNDATKLLYGLEDFLPDKLNLLRNLVDKHGYNLVEFLDYLMKRDKYIDKISLQSDIILLHYKFNLNSFTPQVSDQQKNPEQHKKQNPIKTKPQNPSANGSLSHAELSKLSVRDRSRVIREQRRNQKNSGNQKEEKKRVPESWPLPKDQRLGESSLDMEEISPEEFSKFLVGGRGGL